MFGRGLAAVAVVVVALALAVPAAAARGVVANLDGDRPWERLAVLGVDGLGQRVVLIDTCRGERVRHVISRGWHSIDRLRVRELDGVTRRPEIFVDARSGAAGHVGIIKIVRYTGAGCATLRTLYRYHAQRPTIAPPPGYGVTQFSATARNVSRARPGRELRLWEGYVDADDSLCCPSLARRTLLGYDRTAGRYVPYRTRVYVPAWAS